jgi:cytoskeletal protein CcmA (bactofilin family)
MTHFDELTCLHYLEGLLDREQAREISLHAESCDDCRGLMRALQNETQLLSAALCEQEESVPARLLAPAVREHMPWAWIVSFGLAAAGIYWLWGSILDPMQDRLRSAGIGQADLLTTLLFRGEPWNWWQTAWTGMQALAAISLGAVGFFLIRRSLRKFNTVALVMSGLMLALLGPTGASAVEYHTHDPNYLLPADSVIHDDLVVTGGSIRINGTVEGDLVVAGASARIDGHVEGDVFFSGSTLTIYGTVDGNIRGWGSTLVLHGKTGRNVLYFGGSVVVESDGVVGQDIFMMGGELTIEGRVNRNLDSHNGQVTINGSVGQDMKVEAGDLVIGSAAEIKGKTRYTGNHAAQVAPGAKLGSPIDFTERTEHPEYTSSHYYWHRALSWGAAFIFGMLLILLLRDFFAVVANGTERFESFGLGLLLLIAIPIISVIVCVTIVGLPVGIASFMLYMIAVYSAKTFVSVWLGQKMMGNTLHRGGLIGRLAAGLVVVYALEAIPYHVGFLVGIVVASFGLGSICIALYRHMRPVPVLGAPISPAPVAA